MMPANMEQEGVDSTWKLEEVLGGCHLTLIIHCNVQVSIRACHHSPWHLQSCVPSHCFITLHHAFSAQESQSRPIVGRLVQH